MAKEPGGKAKLFALYKIMFKNTDENHGITIKEILSKLETEYGFSSTAQTIKSDMELLSDIFRIHIVPAEGTFPIEYKLINRTLQYDDIEDLYASIYSNSRLTEEDRKRLLSKLKDLCSPSEAKRIAQKEAAALSFHKGSPKVNAIIKTINDAIASSKAIVIECGTDYLKIPPNYSYGFDVLPIEVFYEKGIPYLYCRFSHKEFDEVLRWQVYKHYFYCIDIRKIKSIKEAEYRWIGATDLKRLTTITEQEIFDNLPVEETILKSKKWSWWGRDPNERISLLVSDELLELTNSKFKDIEIREKEGEMNHVFINAVVSPNLFGWIFEHGEKVKLLSPMPVVNLYKQYVKRSFEMYCNVDKTKEDV